MRKERSTAVGAEVGVAETLTRTTCFLSEAQDYNLDVLALHTGRAKGNLIREGIALVLRQHGFPENDRVQIQIGALAANGASANGQARNGHNGNGHIKNGHGKNEARE
jgi:hypothetical protein